MKMLQVIKEIVEMLFCRIRKTPSRSSLLKLYLEKQSIIWAIVEVTWTQMQQQVAEVQTLSEREILLL